MNLITPPSLPMGLPQSGRLVNDSQDKIILNESHLFSRRFKGRDFIAHVGNCITLNAIARVLIAIVINPSWTNTDHFSPSQFISRVGNRECGMSLRNHFDEDSSSNWFQFHVVIVPLSVVSLIRNTISQGRNDARSLFTNTQASRRSVYSFHVILNDLLGNSHLFTQLFELLWGQRIDILFRNTGGTISVGKTRHHHSKDAGSTNTTQNVKVNHSMISTSVGGP